MMPLALPWTLGWAKAPIRCRSVPATWFTACSSSLSSGPDHAAGFDPAQVFFELGPVVVFVRTHWWSHATPVTMVKWGRYQWNFGSSPWGSEYCLPPGACLARLWPHSVETGQLRTHHEIGRPGQACITCRSMAVMEVLPAVGHHDAALSCAASNKYSGSSQRRARVHVLASSGLSRRAHAEDDLSFRRARVRMSNPWRRAEGLLPEPAAVGHGWRRLIRSPGALRGGARARLCMAAPPPRKWTFMGRGCGSARGGHGAWDGAKERGEEDASVGQG